MTVPNSPAIGLSVGTSTLAAVSPDRVLAVRPVITRGGAPISDFVHRVGDPVGIVAADGSLHSGAELLAEALHDLARNAGSGRPLVGDVVVAYPASWRPAAIEALRCALSRIPVWSAGPLLVPDCAAALTALHADHGLPASGVVAVCDFGASGTTITLVDASSEQVIGHPFHHPEFSGDLVDRALLGHVLASAGVTPGSTGTSAIGALTRLRAECCAAKERLSAQTDTTLPGEPAGVRGAIRLTRAELDETVRAPLTGVVTAVQDSLQRNAIAPSGLTAVAAVGGMAAVPAVIATLSELLRVPIVTIDQPGLAAATGAALRAILGPADAGPTVVTAAPARPERPLPGVPLAWSQAGDVAEFVPQRSTRSEVLPSPRPALDFTPDVPSNPAPANSAEPWYRRPLAVAAAALTVIAAAGGATALALRVETGAVPRAGTTQAPTGPGSAAGLPTVIAIPGVRTVVQAPAAAPPIQGAGPAAQPQPVGEPAPAQPGQAGEPAPTADASAVSSPAPPPPPAIEVAPSSGSAVSEAAAPAPSAEPEAPAPAPAAEPQAPVIPTIPAMPALPSIPAIPTLPPIPIPSIPGMPTLFPAPPSG